MELVPVTSYERCVLCICLVMIGEVKWVTTVVEDIDLYSC
jgi:hypothetical protein